jgi:hypothetical protein
MHTFLSGCRHRLIGMIAVVAVFATINILATSEPAGAAAPTNNFIVKQSQSPGDPTAWLIVDGKRFWIPNGGIYNCLRDHGISGPLLLSNSALDSRPDQHGSHAWCGSSNSPKGHLDSVSSPMPGHVSVRGWAYDPTVKKHSIDIHVYVGNEGHNIGEANNRRADVGRAFPGVGDYHGYEKTIQTNKTGSQNVCAYAIDLGPGGNTKLGCKTVTIAGGSPKGSFDNVSAQQGRVKVRGWAVDPNYLNSPVTIHAYVGGKAGASGAIGYNLGSTGVYRPDVNRVFPGYGNNQGFDRWFPTSKRGSQEVCVYAINRGPGSNKLLGCKNVYVGYDPFLLMPPHQHAGHLALPVDGQAVCRGPATIDTYPRNVLYNAFLLKKVDVSPDGVHCSWWAYTEGEEGAMFAGVPVPQGTFLRAEQVCAWSTRESVVIVNGELRCLWTKSHGPAQSVEDGRYI